MDVSTDTLTSFVPKWGSPSEWNEAYEKVENYLRAYRINSRLHRARIIHGILERVASHGPSTSGEVLSALAIHETQLMMANWFHRMLEPPVANDTSRTREDGRVALLLCDASERWPYAILSAGELPPDLVRAMRESMLVAGPNLEINSMVPREIDYGWFPEIAGDTLEQLERHPFLKAIVVWTLLLLILAFLFYITR